MPLSLTDVGEGFSVVVHCRQRAPNEPHFSRGHEVAKHIDYNTFVSIHHRVASPRTRSLHQAAVSPSLQHQALHR